MPWVGDGDLYSCDHHVFSLHAFFRGTYLRTTGLTPGTTSDAAARSTDTENENLIQRIVERIIPDLRYARVEFIATTVIAAAPGLKRDRARPQSPIPRTGSRRLQIVADDATTP
ncbi:MAG: hypothetical protein BMS9Abin12_2335 [Acidimicrobiia bacterium]|nr:MAG: hypothetical protein BMS9Abin12_2335 [Acidimicrobiia bacterium]